MTAAYPRAFPRCGYRPPLKVGIFRDIVEDGTSGLPAGKVRLFLSIWTRSTSYLNGVARGRHRVGLDGTPCGKVSNENAMEAAVRLASRNKGFG